LSHTSIHPLFDDVPVIFFHGPKRTAEYIEERESGLTAGYMIPQGTCDICGKPCTIDTFLISPVIQMYTWCDGEERSAKTFDGRKVEEKYLCHEHYEQGMRMELYTIRWDLMLAK